MFKIINGKRKNVTINKQPKKQKTKPKQKFEKT